MILSSLVDCVVFEDHLRPDETMAYHLASEFSDWSVLNAGAPHYTTAHAYSRLAFDILRGHRPELVMVFAGINDVLSFLHHKNGTVCLAHTHLYVPWLLYGGHGSRIRRLPLATAKVVGAYLFGGRRAEIWGALVESTDSEFFEPQHVEKGGELFQTTSFLKSLGLFSAICSEIGAELVLTTIYSNAPDIQRGRRATYAWRMEQINQTIRQFTAERNLRIIDLAKELELVPEEDIYNKWHFTASGNRKRAVTVAASLLVNSASG